MISRLEFEGIRCFSTPQCGTVRPLTLLVGENSAGKSTFLAILHAVAHFRFGRPLFNTPPFLLGAYEQIASNFGRAPTRSFSIGYSLEKDDGSEQVLGTVRIHFEPVKGQPVTRIVEVKVGNLRITLAKSKTGCEVTLDARKGTASFSADQYAPQDWWTALRASNFGAGTLSQEELLLLRLFLNEHHRIGTVALAPVRTTPQRTYDPVGSAPQPEGSHVPMLLAELAREGSSQWRTLRRNLAAFGAESGLFEDIDVPRKGDKESDPFQISMGTGGPSVNLVDVGYGVSQVLPILVDTLRLGPRATLLLQQPEVHLHPRAQAELGTFFATRVRKGSNFIIETHSDYLVDRVRMEVREKNLKADQVSILYFERGQRGARIHNLNLDDHGNIVDAPPSYRAFFLREERHLLDVE